MRKVALFTFMHAMLSKMNVFFVFPYRQIERFGINVGNTEILVYACPVTGRK